MVFHFDPASGHYKLSFDRRGIVVICAGIGSLWGGIFLIIKICFFVGGYYEQQQVMSASIVSMEADLHALTLVNEAYGRTIAVNTTRLSAHDDAIVGLKTDVSAMRARMDEEYRNDMFEPQRHGVRK